MTKGFVYSLFAIVLLNLIVFTLAVPIGVDAPSDPAERININELFYFMQSIKQDMARGASIIGKRALVVVTNRAVNSGDPVTRPRNFTAEAFVNGSINGTAVDLMDQNTFEVWMDKMVAQAQSENYLINISVEPHREFAVGMVSSFAVRIRFQYNLSLEDRRIQTGFDRPRQTFTIRVPITGLDDALIILETAGKRANTYERCMEPPAERTATGTVAEYNYTANGSERNWTEGDAFVFNGSSLPGVADPGTKVLVTEQLCDYDPTALDDFAGVISEEETGEKNICGSGEEIQGYVGGVADTGVFTNGSRVVMTGQDAWTNHIPDQIEARCYFHDPRGPSFFDRLEGRLVGDDHGLGSFLAVPELPPEVQKTNASAVDYVYFNESGSYGGTNKIKGVTGENEWFRLDGFHVEYWNISALTYEIK